MAEFKDAPKPKEMPELDVNELKTAKGIPGFWLRAMQNDHDLKERISEADVLVLKHLTDIREELLEENVMPQERPRVELQADLHVRVK